MRRVGGEERGGERRRRRLALRAGDPDRRRRAEAQEQVHLGHERRRRGSPASERDERLERRPQPRLGRRVVRVDRRRRRDERGAGPRSSMGQRPGPARSRTGRPSSASIASASSSSRPPVVDRHVGARRRQGSGPARSPVRAKPSTVTGRPRQRAAEHRRRASVSSRSIGRSVVIVALTPAGRSRRGTSVTPSSPARIPTIQNRSVIFSSSQPTSSKWWWSGAIRKIRLPPVSLKYADLDDHRHRLDDEDQADQRQDEDLAGDQGDDRERRPERQRARVAHEHLGRVDVEPQEAEQRADDQRAQEREVRLLSGSLSSATNTNATKAKTSVPPARPSRPSVMFTPLLAAMIANAAKIT